MRAYHSASGLSTIDGCSRAGFYRYVLGLRDAEVPWSAIAHYKADTSKDEHGILWWRDPLSKTPAPPNLFAPFVPGLPIASKARSASLGKEMHRRREAWYDGQVGIPWNDLPGQIALGGLHNLPAPDKCHDGGVELAIGSEPVGAPDPNDHARRAVGLRAFGVLWVGYRDLTVSAPAEFVRLGIDAPDGWALFDYKSSRDIAAYALRADVDLFAASRNPHWEAPGLLRADFQANLYTYATCIEHKLPSLPLRWLYDETQARRLSVPIDTTIHFEDAAAQVEAAAVRAKAFDAIEREEDAVQNIDHCPKFGGCPYHITAGGPCDARRSLGQLMHAQLLRKGSSKMAIPESAKAAMAAAQAGVAPAQTQAAAAPAAGEATTPAPEKRGRGRPRAAAVAPVATAPAGVADPAPMAAHPQAAAAPAAPAAQPSTGGGPERTVHVPGEFGAIVITANAADLVRAMQTLFNMGPGPS